MRAQPAPNRETMAGAPTLDTTFTLFKYLISKTRRKKLQITCSRRAIDSFCEPVALPKEWLTAPLNGVFFGLQISECSKSHETLFTCSCNFQIRERNRPESLVPPPTSPPSLADTSVRSLQIGYYSVESRNQSSVIQESAWIEINRTPKNHSDQSALNGCIQQIEAREPGPSWCGVWFLLFQIDQD